ncbi:emp24/gp25L/p24 family/GOLD-domain-containing protein [Obelidium mucronatum]|nr:emp24/gp25L/p24 family/GOLD-domain-containing protein [Obelidium mucronatum]
MIALLLTILVSQLAAASNNYHVTVPPQSKHCFVEPMKTGDFLGLSFQVFGGDNLDVDFWVTNPDELIIQSAFRTSTGTFSIDAPKDGNYGYCISNMGHAGAFEKMVSFSINGPDEQRKQNEKKSSQTTSTDGNCVFFWGCVCVIRWINLLMSLFLSKDSKDTLRKEINELTNAIQKVTDEQAYIRQRLLRHHDTAASTNSRVLYWTFFEALIIASVIGFQIVYITQFFNKTHRRLV